MLCRPPEADLQRAAIFMRRAAGSSPPDRGTAWGRRNWARCCAPWGGRRLSRDQDPAGGPGHVPLAVSYAHRARPVFPIRSEDRA